MTNPWNASSRHTVELYIESAKDVVTFQVSFYGSEAEIEKAYILNTVILDGKKALKRTPFDVNTLSDSEWSEILANAKG